MREQTDYRGTGSDAELYSNAGLPPRHRRPARPEGKRAMIEVNLLTVFVTALVAGVGAFFGTYLREKGKNLATKEDVAAISRTTEEIKTEIASGVWLKQRRWDIKWECYSKIAENIG